MRALVLFPVLTCLTACGSSCSIINPGSIEPSQNSPRNYSVQRTPPVIVLFHGLYDKASDLNTIKNQLESKFPDAKIEAFQRDEQQNIEEQAQKTYQELKTRELHQRDLVFVGVSAGGVVAVETLNQHPELAVKGIITYHSPLEGSRLAALVTNETMNQLKSTMKESRGSLVDQLNTPVVQNLTPEASFMQNFKTNLSKISVPMFVIAGEINNNPSPKYSNSAKPTAQLLLEMLTAQSYHNCAHDGLIGKNSQLVHSIHNDNIERFTQSNVDHWAEPDIDAMNKIEQHIKVYLEGY